MKTAQAQTCNEFIVTHIEALNAQAPNRAIRAPQSLFCGFVLVFLYVWLSVPRTVTLVGRVDSALWHLRFLCV